MTHYAIHLISHIRPAATVWFGLIACALVAAGQFSTGSETTVPGLRVTTKRDDDRVRLTIDKDEAVVSIHSPFGISKATLEQTAEKWPKVVVVRLHLKGLENFKLSNSKVKLEGSASVENGKPHMRLWKAGEEERPIDERSPYWLKLRVADADGDPLTALPLKDGYFELQLPAALLEGQRAITVEWIDFYRG